MSNEELTSNQITSIVKFSIAPKLPDDKVKFVFVDTVMRNEITVRTLPPVELVLAIPASYPSNMRPLILQTSPFYKMKESFSSFLDQNINEKWSEEMPVLYEIAIFIQDEFLE